MTKKFLKNKGLNENGEAHVGALLLFLVFSLIFSSASIAYFTTQIYQDQKVNTINFPTGAITYSQSQDFSDCSYNASTWFHPLGGKWNNVCGIGAVLALQDVTHAWSWLILGNEVPALDGSVVNTYKINNTPLVDYVIALRYTGSTDENEIRVSSDGFHIPNYVIPTFGLSGQAIPIGDLAFYPYIGANQVKYATITTQYNDKLNTVTFIFNGKTIFTANNLKSDANLYGLWTHYYGAIGAAQIDFTVQSFNTNNLIALSDNASLLNMVLNFITTMLQIIVWNVPDSILPTMLNIMLIKSQLAGVIICLVIIARG
jgi:hypothetical protein